MSLLFSFEAFRLQHLKSLKSVRVLFVLVLLLLSFSFLVPVGDSDFSKLIEVYQNPSGAFNKSLGEILTTGNLYYLFFKFSLSQWMSLASWIYLALYLKEGPDWSQAPMALESFRKLPTKNYLKRKWGELVLAFLGYVFLSWVTAFLSVFLFWIPYIIFFVSTYYVLPYWMIGVRWKEAFRLAWKAGWRHPFVILWTFLLLFVEVNFLSWLINMGLDNAIWTGLIACFCSTFFVLAKGRLKGILFCVFCRPGRKGGTLPLSGMELQQEWMRLQMESREHE